MIVITLTQQGHETSAACRVPLPEGREDVFAARASTGAKALTMLVEKLTKLYVGEPWEVVNDPHMNGTVPRKRFTRPKRKPLPQLSWC
jgi:hypothetical protein